MAASRQSISYVPCRTTIRRQFLLVLVLLLDGFDDDEEDEDEFERLRFLIGWKFKWPLRGSRLIYPPSGNIDNLLSM